MLTQEQDRPIRWTIPPVADGAPAARIRSASFSRLLAFESCPRKAALAFLCKIPEPERAGESPLDRGSRLHKAIEDFILGRVDALSPEIQHFRELIQGMRERFQAQPESIIVEDRWNFDYAWESCGDAEWDRIWWIAKSDVMVFHDEFEATVYDWKSGKKAGNEVKHGDQLLSYILSAFQLYPKLERVNGELVYIDVRETTSKSLERHTAARLLPQLTRRINTMLEAEAFLPKPSTSRCRFCPYKTGKIDKTTQGTGHCDLNPI